MLKPLKHIHACLEVRTQKKEATSVCPAFTIVLACLRLSQLRKKKSKMPSITQTDRIRVKWVTMMKKSRKTFALVLILTKKKIRDRRSLRIIASEEWLYMLFLTNNRSRVKTKTQLRSTRTRRPFQWKSRLLIMLLHTSKRLKIPLLLSSTYSLIVLQQK
jgi:hypothetical protein